MIIFFFSLLYQNFPCSVKNVSSVTCTNVFNNLQNIHQHQLSVSGGRLAPSLFKFFYHWWTCQCICSRLRKDTQLYFRAATPGWESSSNPTVCLLESQLLRNFFYCQNYVQTFGWFLHTVYFAGVNTVF